MLCNCELLVIYIIGIKKCTNFTLKSDKKVYFWRNTNCKKAATEKIRYETSLEIRKK